MHLHSKHYVHSDIKAENIMIGLHKSLNGQKLLNGCQKSSKTSDFTGIVPFTSCRGSSRQPSRSLRPSKSVAYVIEENSRSTHCLESDNESSDSSMGDEDFELTPRKRKARKAINKAKAKKNASKVNKSKKEELSVVSRNIFEDSQSEDQVYVIDYGLATKFIDTNGAHKPFCMDQRRAHDGTLEFTSRDAHFGAHSRRSDLECLGYNLIYWYGGFLPWKDDRLKEQPEIIHRLKEVFMTDVKEITKILYGKNFPRYLGDFMQYVAQLEFDQEPDYEMLKALLKKEFVKLGYKKSEMKLNINELRDQCEPSDKTLSENNLMMNTITDVKTARKLGFLIVTDSVDGIEPQLKPNDSIMLNVSCKASPKNLRSKDDKIKRKRPKRQPKLSEKELITEKIAQGRKLSLAEIATLDPDQIARERADREYEKFDEKVYYQTPQSYKGNPTYAILEIENRLKNKQNGNVQVVVTDKDDIEPIKGYTKPMMDVLRRQQLAALEQPQTTPVMSLPPTKRNGLKNVINQATEKKAKRGRKPNKKKETKEEPLVVDPPSKPLRGRRNVEKAPVVELEEIPEPEVMEDEEEEVVVVQPVVKRKRGRPKTIRIVIEPPETEEDSVYYDIPGEGSNDGVKEISEDENEPIIATSKSVHCSSDENSNAASTSSGSNSNKKKQRSYYADNDFDMSTDEATNMTSATNVTGSSFNPKRGRGNVRNHGITTRTKTKSRSTSRSAAVFNDASDQSECSETAEKDSSEYNVQSGDESDDEHEQEMDFDLSETEQEDEDEDILSDESEIAESNDSNDSIDIKYSPIKTRHARRRVNHFNLKNIRGELSYVGL